MWRRRPRPRKTWGRLEWRPLLFISPEGSESRLHAGEGDRATPGYFVSILRFIFTVGRVSNWLTVLVSLLCPSNCA